MTANNRWHSVVVIATVCVLMQDANAQSPNEKNESHSSKLMATIEAERLKLISGVMHGSGEDWFEDESKSLRYGGTSQFVFKFDSRTSAFFIDRTCPTPPATEGRGGQGEGRYLLADFRKSRYVFDSRKNFFDSLYICNPRQGGTLDPPEEGFVDPRKLGMSSGDAMFDSSTIEHASEIYLKNLGEPTKPDDQGLMKVVNQSEYRRITNWIDTKHGHTIVRSVFDWGTLSDDKAEFHTALTLSDESVKWELVNGVYVPVSYVVKGMSPYPREGVKVTKFDVNNYNFSKVDRHYDFEWSHVNEPLDASAFDYHNFELPAGTAVIDKRAPKIRANGEVSFPEVERLGKRTIEIPKRRWIGKSLWGAFAIGLVVATVTLLRRYRRRSQDL